MLQTGIGNIASFSCCHSGRRLYFRKPLPNKAVSPHLLSRHTHTHVLAYTNCRLDCVQSLACVYQTLKDDFLFFLASVWACCRWRYTIGNAESHPLIAIVFQIAFLRFEGETFQFLINSCQQNWREVERVKLCDKLEWRLLSSGISLAAANNVSKVTHLFPFRHALLL